MRSDSCFAQWEGRSRLCPVMRPGEALLAPGLDDLLAAIVTARADVMTQMHFARRRLDRERRVAEEIVSTVHAALRRGILVLLDCHRSEKHTSELQSQSNLVFHLLLVKKNIN